MANYNVTITGTFGTWAFLPVTDYSFIPSTPSVALAAKRVNGKSMLVGNNANEGPLFVPPTITTLVDLRAWLHLEFPTLNDADIQAILDAYPSSDAPVDPMALRFATDGLNPPFAVNVSQAATGQLQRGYVRLRLRLRHSLSSLSERQRMHLLTIWDERTYTPKRRSSAPATGSTAPMPPTPAPAAPPRTTTNTASRSARTATT